LDQKAVDKSGLADSGGPFDQDQLGAASAGNLELVPQDG
jgi:hypothetical protein